MPWKIIEAEYDSTDQTTLHDDELIAIERVSVLLGVGILCARPDEQLLLAKGEHVIGRHVVASRPKDAIDDHAR